jgi:hypothetical protein
MKRFYFQILPLNVFECVWADTFIEAKEKAARDWLSYWDQIEWLDITTEPPATTLPVTIND